MNPNMEEGNGAQQNNHWHSGSQRRKEGITQRIVNFVSSSFAME